MQLFAILRDNIGILWWGINIQNILIVPLNIKTAYWTCCCTLRPGCLSICHLGVFSIVLVLYLSFSQNSYVWPHCHCASFSMPVSTTVVSLPRFVFLASLSDDRQRCHLLPAWHVIPAAPWWHTAPHQAASLQIHAWHWAAAHLYSYSPQPAFYMDKESVYG